MNRNACMPLVNNFPTHICFYNNQPAHGPLPQRVRINQQCIINLHIGLQFANRLSHRPLSWLGGGGVVGLWLGGGGGCEFSAARQKGVWRVFAVATVLGDGVGFCKKKVT